MRTLRSVLLTYTLILFSYSAHANTILLGFAKAITTQSYRDRRFTRECLLNAFKNVECANARTLSIILTSYHHKMETLIYPAYADTLHDAIDRFSETPGFTNKIYELLCHAGSATFVKGHMYEIEKALELKKNGESITHFGREFYCPLTRAIRSIDLLTKTELIECKNINWNAYIKEKQCSTINLKEQLLSHRALSERDGMPYVLHSKQKIPAAWQEWLECKKITYHDDTKNS
jgi:hypothetical protein